MIKPKKDVVFPVVTKQPSIEQKGSVAPRTPASYVYVVNEGRIFSGCAES